MITPLVVGHRTSFATELVRGLRAAGFSPDPGPVELPDPGDAEACREMVIDADADVVIDCRATSDFGLRPTTLEHLVRGAANLATAVAERSSHIVFVSSADVFDAGAGGSNVESDSPQPVSPLAHAAVAAERAVSRLSSRHTIIRTTETYGLPWPAAFVDMTTPTDPSGVIVAEPVPLAAPTYAPHLAAVVVALVRHPCYGIFHRAASGDCNRFELTQALVALSGSDRRVERRPVTRPIRAPALLSSRREELPAVPHWRIGMRTMAIDQAAREGDRSGHDTSPAEEPPRS